MFISLIFGIVIMLCKFESPILINRFSIICGVPIIFNVTSYLQKEGVKIPKVLLSSTFFVYASHYYIAVVAIRILASICIGHDILLCVVYLCTPIKLLFILGFIDHFIRQYFTPTIASALLGSTKSHK